MVRAKWLIGILALLLVGFCIWHFKRTGIPHAASVPKTELMPQAIPASTASTPISGTSFCSQQTTELLMNRKYVVNAYDETYRLSFKQGKFNARVDSMDVRAGFLESETGDILSACGDLSGDGSQDNVVAFDVNDGGSYTLIFIVPVLVQNGQLQNGDAFVLGDRVGVKHITITNHNVVIDYVGHGPNEPLCCPETAKTITLKLVGNGFVCADKACKTTMQFD